MANGLWQPSAVILPLLSPHCHLRLPQPARLLSKPLPYVFKEDSTTSMQQVLKRMLQRKSQLLGTALWLFGLGVGALVLLVGRVLWMG